MYNDHKILVEKLETKENKIKELFADIREKNNEITDF